MSNSHQKAQTLCKWIIVPTSWLKLNSDWFKDGTTDGDGGILQNEYGEAIYHHDADPPKQINHLELEGALPGLLHIWMQSEDQPRA